MDKYKEHYTHGIMFHRFHVKKPIGGSITSQELEAVIKIIGRDRILSPQLWLEKCAKKSLGNKDICFTFDDCLKSQYDLALPVLEKYNIKAFFFMHTITLNGKYDYNELFFNIINKNYNSFDAFFIEYEKHLQIDTDIYLSDNYIAFKNNLLKKFKHYNDSEIKYRYLRNIYFTYNQFIETLKDFFSVDITNNHELNNIWMNKNDIKHLSQLGHYIGLHTHNHLVNFKGLDYDAQKNEYEINKRELENIIDVSIQASSHPLGLYNSDTISILKSLGITCSFRSNNLIPDGQKKINPNEYELARNDVSNINSDDS